TKLSASGTSSAATIKGGTAVSLGSRPITLAYDGSHSALTISQGTLTLNGNAFTVNGSQLAGGSAYTIVHQTSGNIASSGSFSVTGAAIGAPGTTAAISVGGGSVMLAINYTTTTTLSSLSNSIYGQPVTFKATVAPTPAGGTVQFYDNGVALGSPVTVSGGTASYITSTLSAGNHPITASYSGITGYSGSTTAGSSVQQVSATALSITASPQTKTYGTLLTFGSGSTNFTSSGLQNSEGIGSVTLAVSGNGGATGAPVGSYTITPSLATGGTFATANYNISYNPGTLTVTLPSNSIPVTIVGVTRLGNGTVRLDFTGTPGYVYLIEGASNLTPPITWTTLSTNAADTNGVFSFTDLNATNYNGRYYRTATQ
ncbi:MAG TPA: Ig-like domain repeat protein, partial [Verrucomicrobiae bacterium]|nr:Ig-like domain repeat protein [Verrucomicrobiae bacterium]